MKDGKDLCSDVPSATKEAPRHTVLSVGKAGAGEDGAEPKDPSAPMTPRCSRQLQSQASQMSASLTKSTQKSSTVVIQVL